MVDYAKKQFGLLSSYTGIYVTSAWNLTVGTCTSLPSKYYVGSYLIRSVQMKTISNGIIMKYLLE